MKHPASQALADAAFVGFFEGWLAGSKKKNNYFSIILKAPDKYRVKHFYLVGTFIWRYWLYKQR